MNAESLTLVYDLIAQYETAVGAKPSCIKMSPDTMKLWFGDEIVTTIANTPIVRNPGLPYGGVYAFGPADRVHDGDLP